MGSIQALITRSLLRKSGIWNKPLEEIRATMAGLKGSGMPEGVAVSTETISGVSCEVFRHSGKASRRTVLYFHGGGFCLGIYAANREFVAKLSQLLNADICMPDYRLAPEHPFPTALDDAQAVYQALKDEENLTVMGDSSGCALALSALLSAKQNGSRMPKAIVMITPVLDLADKGERIAESVRKDPFALVDPLGLTRHYTAGQDTASPAISPIFGELSGLPPMLIHAAQYDVFLSDACRFVEQAASAGVQAELKVWKKMWHIFHMQSPFVPEASRALQEINAFIKMQCP
jgi:acetyl esterase/lipase